MSKSIYQELGDERKHLQSEGKLPLWVTTAAWQILKYTSAYQSLLQSTWMTQSIGKRCSLI